MPQQKVRYGKGKDKRRWKNDMKTRVKRFRNDDLIEDVKFILDRCLNEIENRLKSCPTFL